MQHFTSLFLKFKSNLLVKRIFFLLAVAFAMTKDHIKYIIIYLLYPCEYFHVEAAKYLIKKEYSALILININSCNTYCLVNDDFLWRSTDHKQL